MNLTLTELRESRDAKRCLGHDTWARSYLDRAWKILGRHPGRARALCSGAEHHRKLMARTLEPYPRPDDLESRATWTGEYWGTVLHLSIEIQELREHLKLTVRR